MLLYLQNFFVVHARGENALLPLTIIMSVMSNKTSSTRAPRRVHLHAYESLRRLCVEIQRGRYPTKAALAEAVGRKPRTVQNYLKALINYFDAPLEFDRIKKQLLVKLKTGDPAAVAPNPEPKESPPPASPPPAGEPGPSATGPESK